MLGKGEALRRGSCVVCCMRPVAGSLMCEVCGRSYDRASRADSGTIADVIEWAAKRARFFAKRNSHAAK